MDLPNTLNLLWIIITSILVFLIQIGFTILNSSFSHSKNISIKNIIDLSIVTITLGFIAYSLMHGYSTLNSVENIPLFDIKPNDMHNLFYQTIICATAATIISGAISERAKFGTYVMFTFAFATFIYPIVEYWILKTDSWLTQLSFIDFVGSTAIHIMGGFSAIIYAILLGARQSKYGKDGFLNTITGYNKLYAILGVFILWIVWFSFNIGTTFAITGKKTNLATLIVLNINIAAAAGGIFSLIITWIKHRKANIKLTLNGTLAGIVGITAGCTIVDPLGALIIGAVCGISTSLYAGFITKKINDIISSFSVHCIAGVIGTLLIGIFSTENGILYGGGVNQLTIQLIGAFSVAFWAIAVSFIVVYILKHTVGIRVTLEQEIISLDNTKHNLGFQNNIKNHNLRRGNLLKY